MRKSNVLSKAIVKNLLLLNLLIVPLFLSAQKKEIKEKFKNYTENKVYTIDGNNIVVSGVIDNIAGDKNDIYIRVRSYFTRAYKSSNSVIQTDDKEQGVVIGKGIYPTFWSCSYAALQRLEWSAYHILRVDIKDGKMRVICSASTMDYEFTAVSPTKGYSYNIVSYAPITDKREIDKGKQMEALVHLIDTMRNSIKELEKSVKEGSLSVENEEW